ncbi:hypothetical protein TCON_1844 [Astathelohania contejeani]|uniref:Uncharacterized protein n=1 Tax=Astathelohania contejeani TaxID=164912 RepID=A0ABQ7HXP1_9MICR|nr:hypothetical protein TCON_1844 [Thelohania contejeani]
MIKLLYLLLNIINTTKFKRRPLSFILTTKTAEKPRHASFIILGKDCMDSRFLIRNHQLYSKKSNDVTELYERISNPIYNLFKKKSEKYKVENDFQYIQIDEKKICTAEKYISLYKQFIINFKGDSCNFTDNWFIMYQYMYSLEDVVKKHIISGNPSLDDNLEAHWLVYFIASLYYASFPYITYSTAINHSINITIQQLISFVQEVPLCYIRFYSSQNIYIDENLSLKLVNDILFTLKMKEIFELSLVSYGKSPNFIFLLILNTVITVRIKKFSLDKIMRLTRSMITMKKQINLAIQSNNKIINMKNKI